MLGKIKYLISPFARGKKLDSSFSKLSLFLLTYLSLNLILFLFYILEIKTATNKLENEAFNARLNLNSYYLQVTKEEVGRRKEVLGEQNDDERLEEQYTEQSSALNTSITPSLNAELEIDKKNTQYTAEKVGENTYRVSNVVNDNSMASPVDILNSLNSYRGTRGVSNLSWDNNLAALASERVNAFAANGGLDGHAGFTDFMNNGGFSKTGFNGLGENSAYLSGPMNGERIIKEIFGADAPHDTNQLDPSWTHAGVAVNGTYVNVNFGR